MENITGRDRVHLGASWPAHPQAVNLLRETPIGYGRSEWRWMQLADGTLMLGFFPQSDGIDGYGLTELIREGDWVDAEVNDTVDYYAEDIETVVLPR